MARWRSSWNSTISCYVFFLSMKKYIPHLSQQCAQRGSHQSDHTEQQKYQCLYNMKTIYNKKRGTKQKSPPKIHKSYLRKQVGQMPGWQKGCFNSMRKREKKVCLLSQTTGPSRAILPTLTGRNSPGFQTRLLSPKLPSALPCSQANHFLLALSLGSKRKLIRSVGRPWNCMENTVLPCIRGGYIPAATMDTQNNTRESSWEGCKWANRTKTDETNTMEGNPWNAYIWNHRKRVSG